MKILFITTRNPEKQGDFLEMSILHGLREVMGEDCVDYPKKKIMYHDFSETSKDTLHGRGFSLLTKPIKDIKDREIFDKKFDFVLYGDGHIYGEEPFKEEIDKLATHGVWIIDGHDLYGYAKELTSHSGEIIIDTQFNNCFKRELVTSSKKNVHPTGFGIPSHRIRKINLSIKNQLFQKTAPAHALFENENIKSGYIFTEEEEYYDDMSRSWFGLTSKKGGWDCLRHYEIISAGALLIFRDYKNKPPLCSPQGLPCFSYSTPQELRDLMSRLVIDNTPTKEYKEMLYEQRKWLEDNGTTTARANKILEVFRSVK